jgi:ABC-2 type transport system ATP-binding protein
MAMAIQAQGLVKRYGDVRALDGFDLDVPAGSVCGLLGPNGAGKTTAVRILATLLHADGGWAEVAGADVAAVPHQVRRRIGLSGQTPAVDELLSGRQNLVLFGRLNRLDKATARRRAGELLDQMGLAEAADRPVKRTRAA